MPDNSPRDDRARVLFAVPRSEKTYRNLQPPVEAMTCAAVVRERDIDMTVFDHRVEDELPEMAPDLVVLLTQTYDRTQCYSLALDSVSALATRLRQRYPAAHIVACGVHADIEPALTSAELGGIRCLPGEVEASVPWLCEQILLSGADLAQIDLAAAPRQVDPDTLPSPDFASVDMSRYIGEIVDPGTGIVAYGQAGLLFANRGCPYTCSYCHVWFGQKLRFRSPARVVEDIRAQLAHGTRSFFFLDYTFTFDRAWTLSLCELLREADLEVSWVCQTRCENVDAALLGEMRRAGCVGVYYGVETPWIAQANVRKHTSQAKIEAAIRDTAATGMHPFLFVLLGFEGADPARQDELVAWLGSVPATFSARPLLPRPHTRLFDSQIDEAAASWPDLKDQSLRLGYEYWPAELEQLQARLRALPNNVLNAQAS